MTRDELTREQEMRIVLDTFSFGGEALHARDMIEAQLPCPTDGRRKGRRRYGYRRFPSTRARKI